MNTKDILQKIIAGIATIALGWVAKTSSELADQRVQIALLNSQLSAVSKLETSVQNMGGEVRELKGMVTFAFHPGYSVQPAPVPPTRP